MSHCFRSPETRLIKQNTIYFSIYRMTYRILYLTCYILYVISYTGYYFLCHGTFLLSLKQKCDCRRNSRRQSPLQVICECQAKTELAVLSREFCRTYRNKQLTWVSVFYLTHGWCCLRHQATKGARSAAA